MVRYFFLLLVILVPVGVFANTNGIAQNIKNNCLLNDLGGIEHCPVYRQDMAELNRELKNNWTQVIEKQSLQSLVSNINNDIKQVPSRRIQVARNTGSDKELFIFDYKIYVTSLFRRFLESNTDDTTVVHDFFEKTYFDQDQSGLGIMNIALHTGPEQYDKNISTKISIRNYSTETIDTIEDIYCFASVNNQDLIFPLEINHAFAQNSITNLIVDVPVQYSDLMDTYGRKKIACVIVYTHQEQEKYSNRKTLDFKIRK